MNDSKALINCASYRDGKKLADASVKDVSEILAQEDTFVWVGLFEPDQQLMAKVQAQFCLHELAVEDAQLAHQRPKLEEYGETLFVVLHTATLEGEQIAYGETHLFVGPRFVLTVRHGHSAGYASVRQRTESMPDRLAHGPGYVLYSIIDFVVDQYQPCIDKLQEKFRRLEEQLFQPKSQSDNLQDFYELKNELMTLHAAAIPLVDICTQLIRFHSDIIPTENRVYYRDILDHVARVTQAADRMREMINAAMQVSLAQITIRQNDVVKQLAGWGAILAVPTMLFSLYGMNFQYMPELKWKGSYPTLMAVIAGACFLLYRRLRREGWL